MYRAYLRRINIKHRVVYEILEEEKIVKIISMWTHYGFQLSSKYFSYVQQTKQGL